MLHTVGYKSTIIFSIFCFFSKFWFTEFTEQTKMAYNTYINKQCLKLLFISNKIKKAKINSEMSITFTHVNYCSLGNKNFKHFFL